MFPNWEKRFRNHVRLFILVQAKLNFNFSEQEKRGAKPYRNRNGEPKWLAGKQSVCEHEDKLILINIIHASLNSGSLRNEI